MSGILLAASIGKKPITYKLDDFSIHGNAPEGQTADADAIFNTNGSIQERRDLGGGGTSTTTSEASPWSDDPSEDGTGHHVRIASHDTGSNRIFGTPTLGTWTALSAQITFDFRDSSTSGPYDGTSTYTMELSDDGGSTVLDSCTLTIRLSNDGP